MEFRRGDPRRALSERVQTAFDDSIDTAALMGQPFDMTYGTLASRLVEAEIVEPTVEAVCDYLGIKRNEWGEVSGNLAVEKEYKNSIQSLIGEVTDHRRRVHRQGFDPFFETARNATWQIGVETRRNVDFDELQELKNGYRSALDEVNGMVEEDEYDQAEMGALAISAISMGTKYSALQGGYGVSCVSLEDFARRVIGMDLASRVFGGNATGALAKLVSKMSIAADIFYEEGIDYEAIWAKVPAYKVYLGRDQISDFTESLFDEENALIEARAQADVVPLRKLLTFQKHEDHELFQP